MFFLRKLFFFQQVLEQFWSGANGGKPYQTPEEAKVEGDTTVDSGVERKTSHEELLTKGLLKLTIVWLKKSCVKRK